MDKIGKIIVCEKSLLFWCGDDIRWGYLASFVIEEVMIGSYW